MVIVMASEIGERETRRNWSPRIGEYQAFCGAEEGDAWCACLVCWAAGQAAAELEMGNPFPRTASVHKLFRKLLMIPGVKLTTTPKRGCLAFRDYGKGKGHVCLVWDVPAPYGDRKSTRLNSSH